MSGRVIPFSIPGDNASPVTEQADVIVLIGRDQELLRLRAMVIGSAGFNVRSVNPDQAAAELQKTRGVRVWVFCHTLEFYEMALLAVAIRNEHPADKLLQMVGLNEVRQLPGLFDELLEPVTSVDDLVRTVSGLAKP